MLKTFSILSLFLFSMTKTCETPKEKAEPYSNTTDTYTIVIHGGAGTIKKKLLTPEKEKEYRQTLEKALKTGETNLKNGGTAVETVEMVIKILEDSPLFNAGKGAVYNNKGYQEMDASIMDGIDLSSGAIAGVTNLKNPIEAARIVKDSTRHVFLYGKRGQEFCINKGAKYVDRSYFYSEYRWNQYQRALKKNKIELDHSDDSDNSEKEAKEIKKFGTVGCVVLDTYGNLAAGTSTGGLTNKKYGRIGDSPIVGAGTYADNKSCAVSCTGTGEYFIRGTIARDIAAIIEFKGVSLQKSGEETLEKLTRMKGKGGFISIDKNGNYILMFNTKGMYRGIASSSGIFKVAIFGDE